MDGTGAAIVGFAGTGTTMHVAAAFAGICGAMRCEKEDTALGAGTARAVTCTFATVTVRVDGTVFDALTGVATVFLA